jgi:internalin A
MRDELLQLMMRFKLCYEIPHRPRTYIAPQLLSPNQPKYIWDDTDNLILRYHYDFMPKGMLTRFSVEMHKLIDNELIWKDGIILADSNARAEVIEAYYKNEIRIRVSGTIKKSLREAIRHEFRKIHDSYERLRYQEYIPCNCLACKGSQTPFSYSLNRLEERLNKNRNQIECDFSYKMVDVRDLIDDAIGDSRAARSSPKEIPTQTNHIRGEPTHPNTPIIIQNHIHNTNQTEQLMSNDNTWIGDQISGDKVMGNKVSTGDVAGDAIAGNKIVNTQNMTQTAQEIKVLVNQYASNYDTTTPSGKMGLSGKVLESVEKNPTLKSRTINALKEAGKTAFEEAIDHPVAKVLVAGLEGFME